MAVGGGGMLMGWSSSTPTEAMSGSLVHPSARPQGKMVPENAWRALATHPGHLQVSDPAGPLGRCWASRCLSLQVSGGSGWLCLPTPTPLRTPAAARDSSGLRAPSRPGGPLWAQGTPATPPGRRAGGTTTASSFPPHSSSEGLSRLRHPLIPPGQHLSASLASPSVPPPPALLC